MLPKRVASQNLFIPINWKKMQPIIDNKIIYLIILQFIFVNNSANNVDANIRNGSIYVCTKNT